MLSWVFAYVYSTTKGGPNFASYVIEFYIFDNAFTFRSPSSRPPRRSSCCSRAPC